MPLHSSDFVFEDTMVESSFEFALPGGRGRHLHRRLTSTEYNKVLLRSDGGGVEWGVGHKSFQGLQVTS